MKLLHVIADIDPANGGPQSVVIHLAAAQTRSEAGVTIASYSSSGIGNRAKDGIPGAEMVAIASLHTESPVGRFTASAAATGLAPLVRSADFVHLHGVWEPLLLQAGRLAERYGVPYCISPHGMLDPWSLGQKRLKKAVALRLGFRRMLDEAAFVHVLNDDERRLIAPLGLTAPMRTIPNGVSIEEVDEHAVRGRFRARFPEIGDEPYVLFLSRLHPKKGLDILAEAFSGLQRRRDGVRLVVAGPEAGAGSAFRAAIAAHGLEDRTHVVGPLYGAAKYEAFADAACFCLPSRQEGFSVAIIEALACATPAVISDACHFPEVATLGAGRVLPLTADAFAEALDEMISDSRLARRMGEQGRRLVEDRLTWRAIASQTLAAYDAHLKPVRASRTSALSAAG